MSEASSGRGPVDPHHERGRPAGGHDRRGLVGRDGGHRERPAQPGHRGPQRLGQRTARRHLLLEQVGEDLGVGLRGQPVAPGHQPLGQLGVVLDDAVVDHGQAAGAVEVGVGVLGVGRRGWPSGCGRSAVRRPGGASPAEAGQLVHRVGARRRPGPARGPPRPPGPPRPSRSRGTRGGAGRRGRRSSASAAPVAPMIPHTGRRLPTRRARPRRARSLHRRAQPAGRLLGQVRCDRLHHDPDHRLGAAGAQQHPAAVAELGLGLGHRPPDHLGLLEPPGVGDGHVHQDLGDPLDQAGRELGQRAGPTAPPGRPGAGR